MNFLKKNVSGILFFLSFSLLFSLNRLQGQNASDGGIIVPAYFFPYDNDTPGKHEVGPYWSQLIDAAEIYGDKLIVVANRDDGPGADIASGWNYDQYKKAIDGVRAAGGIVIGYVHTCYGLTEKKGNCANRDLARIHRDIQRWKNLFDVDGIFLDEAPSSKDKQKWLSDLNDHIETIVKAGAGLSSTNLKAKYTVNNFGTMPDPEYLSSDNPEIQVILEQTASYFEANKSKLSTVDYNAAALVHTMEDDYAVTRRNFLKEKNINWFYCTEDIGRTKSDNPWNDFSKYFSRLMPTPGKNAGNPWVRAHKVIFETSSWKDLATTCEEKKHLIMHQNVAHSISGAASLIWASKSLDEVAKLLHDPA